MLRLCHFVAAGPRCTAPMSVLAKTTMRSIVNFLGWVRIRRALSSAISINSRAMRSESRSFGPPRRVLPGMGVELQGRDAQVVGIAVARDVRDGGGELADRAILLAVDERLDESGQVRELLVDDRPRDAGALGDRLDRDGMEAALHD